MKAVFVERPFDIKIVDIPKPQITNPTDVLIRVLSGGICGSDIGIYNGSNSLATYPRIIGHEYGGIVVETGSLVTAVNVGDYVAVDPVRTCGNCYACTHQRHNVCANLKVTAGLWFGKVNATAALCMKQPEICFLTLESASQCAMPSIALQW